MNQREIEVMKLTEDLKDTLQNEIIKQNAETKENKRIDLKDIKLVGEVIWKDKVSGKPLTDRVFIADIEIKEIDDDGKMRITEQQRVFLGENHIGGRIGDGQIIYKQAFENTEPEKVKVINELLEKTTEQEIEQNSLSELKTKEMQEVLSAYYGKKVEKEEIEKLLEEMNEQEIKELQEEKEERQEEGKDEKDLSEKQVEKIKLNGIQKADLDKLVDGKETLGKRLDLEQYDSIYVVYSEKVNEITADSKRNNTTYALVGMKKDGEARVLDDEFEMDKTVGNNGQKEQTKIRANSTATRDNNDLSVFTRKTNGMSIGCENDYGRINMFMYQKTLEENENVGIQIETSQTQVIPLETRELMNRNKGIYQEDKLQDEIQEHTDEGCEPQNVKDFDGNETTETHSHDSNSTVIENAVEEIMSYQNQYGEEVIKEVFTKDEVKDKLVGKMKETKGNYSIEEIAEIVQREMGQDAENFYRERKY